MTFLEFNNMIKTISFAILHMTVAFTVAYIMTGSVVVGGALALVEPLCNIVVFYFHEMFWNWHDRKNAGSGTDTGTVLPA